MNGIKLAAAVLGLVCGPALAQSCQPIEYAEVKDWPVEKVEEAYCRDLQTSIELIDKEYREVQARGRVNAVTAAYAPYLQRCDQQLELYTRVLENRFSRKPPSCKTHQP